MKEFTAIGAAPECRAKRGGRTGGGVVTDVGSMGKSDVISGAGEDPDRALVRSGADGARTDTRALLTNRDSRAPGIGTPGDESPDEYPWLVVALLRKNALPPGCLR